VCSAGIADADRAVTPFLFPVAADESQPHAAATAFCSEIDRRLSDAREEAMAAERFDFVLRRYSWPACGAEYRELIRAALHDARGRVGAGTSHREAGQV